MRYVNRIRLKPQFDAFISVHGERNPAWVIQLFNQQAVALAYAQGRFDAGEQLVRGTAADFARAYALASVDYVYRNNPVNPGTLADAWYQWQTAT